MPLYWDFLLFFHYTTHVPLFSRISPERIEASIHHVYNHVLFVCVPGFPLKKLACLRLIISQSFVPKMMLILAKIFPTSVELNQEALCTEFFFFNYGNENQTKRLNIFYQLLY